jgi:glycosyltransferase involved in cell wall biosynthesis
MSERWPKITVVTPSYNQGRFIERTVASVLDQNYPNLEYFVFDGGSTDGTREVLRRYSSSVQWASEKDEGQAHAVNKGLRASSGEIVGWLNSDDIYYSGALSTIASRFQAEPAVDVIYGRANHIDVSDKVIEAYPTEHWSMTRLTETCFLCQPAVFFRRSVVERWGELDEALDYCMDYEYWIRLAFAGARFHYEQQVLAGSRFYPETKTLGARVKVHAEINDMLKSRLGRTPLSWILGYAHVVADDVFGIPRSRRKRHLAAMTLMALYSSLRWNRAVTGDLARYLLSATGAALGIKKRA